MVLLLLLLLAVALNDYAAPKSHQRILVYSDFMRPGCDMLTSHMTMIH